MTASENEVGALMGRDDHKKSEYSSVLVVPTGTKFA